MKRKSRVRNPIVHQICKIKINKIEESTVSLRTEYDQEKLEELSESLDKQGLLQTIVVQPSRRKSGYYELVIGSRRLRAAKLKGMKELAAYVIKKRNSPELLMIALAENLHRADLNPFEEAKAFLRLAREFSFSTSDIARGINKPPAYITNRLELLTMPDEVITLISEKALPINVTHVLARYPPEQQIRLARLAVKHHLSTSELSTRAQKELLNDRRRTGYYSYKFTSMKVTTRLSNLSIFIDKIPTKMELDRLTEDQKNEIRKELNLLEKKIESLRNKIESSPDIKVEVSAGIVSTPSIQPTNPSPDDWSQTEIEYITSPVRPSDDVLAKQLDRSVSDIRSMRAKTTTASEKPSRLQVQKT